jgi:hypothetical protein
MVALGQLLVEDDVEAEVEEGVGVYQCVDVTNVVMVLSPLVNTTTAVLVDSPPGTDVTIATVEPCTEVVGAVVEAGAGVEYVDDATVLEAVSEDEVDGDTDEAMVEEAVAASCEDDAAEDPADALDEAVELEAAAQVTSRVNCTPLLAQVESNVAAAAVRSLAMEHCEGELGGLTLLIGTVTT